MQRRPPIVPLALLAALCLGASCSGTRETGGNGGQQGNGHEAAAPRVESLEAVDTSELSRSETRVWVELINDLLSPCGEPVSVGRCVSENRSCRRCVPAARYLSRLISEGYERTQIEELYAARYGQGNTVEIDTEGAPSRGSPMAQVTIIEFSDFECPFCGRAHPIVQQLLRDFEGRVRVVFRNYPLPGHPRAMPAARAAVAAGQQGKFWEMHDLLFEHQTRLSDDDLDSYAEQLGLDINRFHQDMDSTETQTAVDHDRNIGQRANIESTPSFFVDGRRYREPPGQLPDYVREELDQ